MSEKLFEFEESLPLDESASVAVSVEAEAMKICYSIHAENMGYENRVMSTKDITEVSQCMHEFVAFRADSLKE